MRLSDEQLAEFERAAADPVQFAAAMNAPSGPHDWLPLRRTIAALVDEVRESRRLYGIPLPVAEKPFSTGRHYPTT